MTNYLKAAKAVYKDNNPHRSFRLMTEQEKQARKEYLLGEHMSAEARRTRRGKI